ncbi:MAG TPA: serine/threonine-protein kinase [Thermoanaerobaculia bacterium]
MTEIPQSFDRFEIVRILGRGGMGTVYLARDRRLGRQVALKVLNSDSLSNDDRRARFMREAKAAAAIRHQNVATIYEVDETEDGQPFLVMEYCEGETLSQRLRRRPLDAGEFLHIARQLAAGLAAAHDNGVVHRDIKSANIIIEPNGLAKILDFGLAKLVPRVDDEDGEKPTFESTSGHFFGTLHYLSPEQARGATADERSDLFAVGVVLYQMAAGHLPFNAESPLMVIDKIRDSEPEPFTPLDPGFPTAAAKIIGRLLQKSPSSRYQNARELLVDLEEMDTPTLRMNTSGLTRSSLPKTLRRPRMIRIGVAIVALLIVAVAIYLVQSRSDGLATTAEAAAPQPIRSLAVLPLQNLANNTRDEFLSVGVADALVTKLQQIPSLQVRPTSAVMEFQNKNVDVKSASEKLQVDGILKGSFLAAGDLVRVQLQLTDTRTGYNVWAESIDGRRDDLLTLIDNVSARTLTGLNERLGVATSQMHSEARSTNPKAYEEYIKARALTGTLVPQQYQAQIAALKRAIELDADFAAAYADLAIALSLGQARSLADESDFQRAEWYARQAIRLDPNLPQSHMAMGRVLVRDPQRFTESVREVLAALRLKANDTHALYSMLAYFISTGDVQRAQCIGDRLIRIDPLSNEAKTRGYWYINAVDAEAALQSAQYAMASRDTELAGRDIRGNAYVLLGNLTAAQAEAEAAADLVPRHYIGKSLKAMIAAARGDRAATEQHIKSFESDANRNHWAALRVALCYAKLGDRNLAIQWLHRAASLGNHSWYALVKHPWLQSLQTDPEFQQIVSAMKADLDDVRDDVVGVYGLLCK